MGWREWTDWTVAELVLDRLVAEPIQTSSALAEISIEISLEISIEIGNNITLLLSNNVILLRGRRSLTEISVRRSLK